MKHGRLRPVCPVCGHIVFFDPKVAVIAFVKQDNRILLVQRDVEPSKGLWSMPGGFVELGENPTFALEREVLEETGLDARIDDLLDIFHYPDSYVIVIAYAATVGGGDLAAGDDAAQAIWFTKEELPEQLAFKSSTNLVRRWIAGEI